MALPNSKGQVRASMAQPNSSSQAQTGIWWNSIIGLRTNDEGPSEMRALMAGFGYYALRAGMGS